MLAQPLPPLKITPEMIRDAARERLQGESVMRLVVRQAVDELVLNLREKVRFRRRDNDAAVQAYCAMSLRRFEGINARQRWANWRTIPKNLNRHIPARPVAAIDLCAGSGDSTEVLAYYLAPGSRILGIEFNARFVDGAKARRFYCRSGELAKVDFRCQSVLEHFHDAHGRLIADQSVDLVNCCGAIGHHFDADATRIVARETARVLKRGGVAMVDAGDSGTSPEETLMIFHELGFQYLNQARSCFVDRVPQLCFRKI